MPYHEAVMPVCVKHAIELLPSYLRLKQGDLTHDKLMSLLLARFQEHWDCLVFLSGRYAIAVFIGKHCCDFDQSSDELFDLRVSIQTRLDVGVQKAP